MKYYKVPKLSKALDIAIWIILASQVFLFSSCIYFGSWKAFVSYAGAAILAILMWWVYNKHYPRMDKMSKETLELREDCQNLTRGN